MFRKYDKIIKDHYDKVALLHKKSSSSTMQDIKIRSLETDFILSELNKLKKKRIKILDVGCGNGYSLSIISKKFKKFDLYGYEQNLSLLKIASDRLKNKAKIFHKDIRRIDKISEKFDLIICQRVIINILNSKDQKKALKNLICLVKKNGVLLFIETFKSSIKSLNKIRKTFKLKPIRHAYHNKPLNDKFFKNKKLREFYIDKNQELSSHYLIARVLHPIYIINNKIKFQHNSNFVNFFSNELTGKSDSYSYIKLLKFKKILD
ncbi:class I SAM-dependent methyltransferase [Candidatus Pelagibacter sp. HIMB1748]|uniref:class I SAM-dependent methyltransferase n=1 Tax=unclassified Candidatus Pelagibacter TaxID=2647897 RepID=UPI003F824B41